MNKFFLIALYALVLSLSFQYFFPAKKTILTQDTSVLLSIADESLVIPNIPKISIINNTASGFTLLPCRDIRITIDSQPLTDIEKTFPDFCLPQEVWPNTPHLIQLDPIAPVFAAREGKYLITLVSPVGERVVTLSLSPPGSIRSFLTTTVYEPIYNLFVALLTFLPGHSLGWAIVMITLIVRLVLLVPQHHMLQSQKKLQIIQPKIKALQEKYKTDQAKLGMEMIELYKKEWVNPMGSCLPLLIQMPILIGLYWVISGISDASNFYHLYSFFSSFQPSHIATNFYGINLLQIGGKTAILFALALAVIQYIQARLSFTYQPTPEKKEKKVLKEWELPEMALDPEMMKKMMLYFFPIMIAVSAYFFPLGVGLYWFIGTLFVIAQQAYVNRKTTKS